MILAGVVAEEKNSAVDTYLAAVLADTPLAYYRLDDTSSTLTDASGNAHNGTYPVTPTQSQSSLIVKSTNASSLFNGSTQYGQATLGGFAVNMALGWSLEFVVKLAAYPSSGNQGQPVAVHGGSGSFTIMGIQINSAGKVSVFWFNGANAYTFVQSPGSLSLATKYICVLSVSASGAFTLYVNNVSFITGTMSGSNTTWNTVPALRIGCGFNGTIFTTTEFLNATEDEIAFYTAALTATQVGNHWTASGN